MKLNGCVAALAALGVLTVACSGRYDVGFEPMPGGSAGQATAGTEASGDSGGSGGSGGGTNAASGSTVVGAAGEGESSNSRCGFVPAAIGAVDPLVTTDIVVERIGRFLEGTAAVSVGSRPPEPNAAWAAELAMQIVDEHAAAGTEALGLAAFLEGWLNILPESLPLEAAHAWAVKLADPDATLSTLLAEPSGEPHRIGILTDQDVLAARGRITGRGVWMNRRLFCREIPAPPADIPALPEQDPNAVTWRQKLENATSPPSCRSCHQLMDPPGFSLGHFDETGAYREQDNGEAVDSSGVTMSPAFTFSDFDSLAPQLAQSCEVARCFVTAVAGHATSQQLALTEAELNHAANAFADSEFSIRELVKAIVTSPSFFR